MFYCLNSKINNEIKIKSWNYYLIRYSSIIITALLEGYRIFFDHIQFLLAIIFISLFYCFYCW
jgi:hypothetical protein